MVAVAEGFDASQDGDEIYSGINSIYNYIYNYIYKYIYLFIFIFICLFRYSLVRGQNPTINQQIFGICFPMFSADSQHVGTTRRRRNQKYQGAHL